jgi:anti-sigma factor RsiW
MNMHDSVTDRLSEYVDGDLTADERSRVETHVDTCAECRAVVADLRQLTAAASRLPESAPDRDLWSGIAPRIGATQRTASVTPFRRRFSFTMPQLAAAGIALMLASGGLVYVLRPEPPAVTATSSPGEIDPAGAVRPVALVDPQFDGAVADLERTLEAGRGRLDPETVRVLEHNLAAIDTAIEQCRRALEADPANSFLNSHLVSARQRKLALLRRATALTTGS